VGFADGDGEDLAGVGGEAVEDDDLVVLSAGDELDFIGVARGSLFTGLPRVTVAVEFARLDGGGETGA
jgi:hypothetical protein